MKTDSTPFCALHSNVRLLSYEFRNMKLGDVILNECNYNEN